MTSCVFQLKSVKKKIRNIYKIVTILWRKDVYPANFQTVLTLLAILDILYKTMIRICYTYGTCSREGKGREAGLIEVPAAGEHKHILVVHRSMGDLQQLKRILSSEYRVGLASSLPAAFAYLSAHLPDLLLLDAHLSEFQGRDALEILEEKPRTWCLTVVFLISDLNQPVHDAGAYGLIPWPAPVQVFLDDIRAFAAHSSAQ